MANPNITITILGEGDVQTEIEVCPLIVTDFKNMHGGESIQVQLPEDFGDMEIAVVLVTKPVE